MQSGGKAAGHAGEVLAQLFGFQQTGIQAEGPCVHQPGFVIRFLPRVAAEIGDARLPETGFLADAAVHVLPEGKAFHRQRQFGRIAPHLPDPAPIPAGLFAGNETLFA